MDLPGHEKPWKIQLLETKIFLELNHDECFIYSTEMFFSNKNWVVVWNILLFSTLPEEMIHFL